MVWHASRGLQPQCARGKWRSMAMPGTHTLDAIVRPSRARNPDVRVRYGNWRIRVFYLAPRCREHGSQRGGSQEQGGHATKRAHAAADGSRRSLDAVFGHLVQDLVIEAGMI
jgi:hypothetical protein